MSEHIDNVSETEPPVDFPVLAEVTPQEDTTQSLTREEELENALASLVGILRAVKVFNCSGVKTAMARYMLWETTYGKLVR